jgi:hypothetical protein
MPVPAFTTNTNDIPAADAADPRWTWAGHSSAGGATLCHRVYRTSRPGVTLVAALAAVSVARAGLDADTLALPIRVVIPVETRAEWL